MSKGLDNLGCSGWNISELVLAHFLLTRPTCVLNLSPLSLSLRAPAIAFCTGTAGIFCELHGQRQLGPDSKCTCCVRRQWASQSEKRQMHWTCRTFSVAVDFPKTGVPAIIPAHLRPRNYPDFMEKEDKITYKSECVIGTLFRSVKEAAKEQFHSLELSKRIMLENYDSQLQVIFPLPKWWAYQINIDSIGKTD